MLSSLFKGNRGMAGMVFAVFVLTVFVQGQSESGVDAGNNFQGRVRFENNAPAQFVQVELWTDGEASWRTITQTDRTGKFQVGTPCMVIQYKIETPGYSPVYGRVDMSVKPCRVSEWVTLKQIRKEGAGGTPASGVMDSRIAAIPPEAKAEFEEGQRLVRGNDFAGATPHLQKAVDLYPKYAEAYQLLAVAQLQTNQGQQAEASLVKAIGIEDRMPKAQYLLGVLYAMTNRVELAEKPLNRFAELDPQNPDAHFELARVEFALHKFLEAEVQARTAIKLKETKPGAYIVLGYALLRQKKVDDAKHAFQQFLKMDSSGPMATDVKDLLAQIDQRANR